MASREKLALVIIRTPRRDKSHRTTGQPATCEQVTSVCCCKPLSLGVVSIRHYGQQYLINIKTLKCIKFTWV